MRLTGYQSRARIQQSPAESLAQPSEIPRPSEDQREIEAGILIENLNPSIVAIGLANIKQTRSLDQPAIAEASQFIAKLNLLSIPRGDLPDLINYALDNKKYESPLYEFVKKSNFMDVLEKSGRMKDLEGFVIDKEGVFFRGNQDTLDFIDRFKPSPTDSLGGIIVSNTSDVATEALVSEFRLDSQDAGIAEYLSRIYALKLTKSQSKNGYQIPEFGENRLVVSGGQINFVGDQSAFDAIWSREPHQIHEKLMSFFEEGEAPEDFLKDASILFAKLCLLKIQSPGLLDVLNYVASGEAPSQKGLSALSTIPIDVVRNAAEKIDSLRAGTHSADSAAPKFRVSSSSALLQSLGECQAGFESVSRFVDYVSDRCSRSKAFDRFATLVYSGLIIKDHEVAIHVDGFTGDVGFSREQFRLNHMQGFSPADNPGHSIIRSLKNLVLNNPKQLPMGIDLSLMDFSDRKNVRNLENHIDSINRLCACAGHSRPTMDAVLSLAVYTGIQSFFPGAVTSNSFEYWETRLGAFTISSQNLESNRLSLQNFAKDGAHPDLKRVSFFKNEDKDSRFRRNPNQEAFAFLSSSGLIRGVSTVEQASAKSFLLDSDFETLAGYATEYFNAKGSGEIPAKPRQSKRGADAFNQHLKSLVESSSEIGNWIADSHVKPRTAMGVFAQSLLKISEESNRKLKNKSPGL